jgi:hypothetical protein
MRATTTSDLRVWSSRYSTPIECDQATNHTQNPLHHLLLHHYNTPANQHIILRWRITADLDNTLLSNFQHSTSWHSLWSWLWSLNFEIWIYQTTAFNHGTILVTRIIAACILSSTIYTSMINTWSSASRRTKKKTWSQAWHSISFGTKQVLRSPRNWMINNCFATKFHEAHKTSQSSRSITNLLYKRTFLCHKSAEKESS